MPGLRSSLLAFLVLAWCHGCICFQSLPLSSPMRCGIAQNSGFASICGSGGPSGASCALLGPARNVRRSRGLKQLGLRGLSSKATPDYYKVLGVGKKADTKEIKRAYKRLAVKFHPDVNKEEGAKNRFVEINEAYSILSDEAERRKYDMRRNPFEGWSAARPGGGTGRQGWSGGGASASGFDFDEYWSQFRSKEETPKDIDDSFEKILDDLFSGVRSRRKVGGGGRRRDSLLDDFGSFLETMLGREDLRGDDAEAEVDGLAEEELRAEADDCAYVVTQLGERATHLRREAVAAEERGAEWDRKGKAAGGETAAAARDKAEALRRSATRLRDRAAKVDEMQLSQKQRLKRLRARLRGEKPPSQSPSRSAGAGGGGGAGDKEVVSCPECFQKLRVPSGRAGTARCPNCSYSWEPNVPASDGAGSEGGAEAAAAERRVVGCPKCAQKIGVPKGRDGFVKCPTCAHQFSTATPGRDASGPEAASRTPPRTAQRFPDQYATSWQEEQKMKQELARAKAEEDLAKLKKELGL